MAEFSLPKNSVIKKGKAHAPDQGARLKSFKIYRYDPDSGRNHATILTPSTSTNAGR